MMMSSIRWLAFSVCWFAVSSDALLTGGAPVGHASRGIPILSFRTNSFISMVSKEAPPDFTIIEDDKDEENSQSANLDVPPTEAAYQIPNIRPKTIRITKRTDADDNGWKKRNNSSPSPTSRKKNPRMVGTSWMQKNAAFINESFEDEEEATNEGDGSPRRKNRTFRQDFQGTRVFVKGIPSDASWQDLKDHFAVAGTVVFASVSVDPLTGKSKNVGIVQFETNEMAHNAIKIMRKYPLDGSVLYVREDVQEQRGGGDGARLRNLMPRSSRHSNSPPSRWECADDENSSILSAEERESVLSLISARDAARRRKNYGASDQMREDLKSQFGVHLDDRLKSWWVSFDGSAVPRSIKAVKGEGRWGGKKAWTQIQTTPENDACVNPDLVNGLLMQRDIARREKDFATADKLLEEARTSPDGDLSLRIHDESRTWRIWTEEKPRRPMSVDHLGTRKSAAEQCIELIREKAPHKEEEITILLQKFPGREYPILRKLRKSLRDV